MYSLDTDIKLENIKNPSFLDTIANFIEKGIDYYNLLSFIRPKSQKPRIEVENYNMASGTKEGYYNATVTLREKNKKYTGHAREVKGLVNAAIKATMEAVPYSNIKLCENNPVEIRMVSPTIEGPIEVIVRVLDTTTNLTYVGSFAGYDIMGACVHAFIDGVNQILNPEVRSHGLYRSFVNLMEDPETRKILTVQSGKIYFPHRVINRDIRAVFFMIRAIKGRDKPVKL